MESHIWYSNQLGVSFPVQSVSTVNLTSFIYGTICKDSSEHITVNSHWTVTCSENRVEIV